MAPFTTSKKAVNNDRYTFPRLYLLRTPWRSSAIYYSIASIHGQFATPQQAQMFFKRSDWRRTNTKSDKTNARSPQSNGSELTGGRPAQMDADCTIETSIADPEVLRQDVNTHRRVVNSHIASSAVVQVFNTQELVEMILLILKIGDLIAKARFACRSFNMAISSSPTINKRLAVALQDAMPAPGEVRSHYGTRVQWPRIDLNYTGPDFRISLKIGSTTLEDSDRLLASAKFACPSCHCESYACGSKA